MKKAAIFVNLLGIYQELYAKNKQNEEYFDGVVRTLTCFRATVNRFCHW
jgi:hypothetical protein